MFYSCITSILSWLSIEIPSEYPIEYLIFLPAFSMLTAIVYDSRTGFYATVTMSLMIAGIRGNDYTTAIVMLFSGTLAAYTVRDIQNRTQMFRSIFYIFIGFLLPILVFGFERASSWNLILHKLSLTAVNAILSPLITFGLLFLIDRSTNFATDLRLEEFDNLDHPLMVKLREVAPGTYQHSISLAMLAERCASAINVNHTFVKVASYFHDIGKMERPEYFGENQLENMGNKHDLISPKKSALIIIDHVPFGAELAKEHKLPERIIDIIYMHHGTSLVKHFYAKAIEQSKGETINEEDFKYPGPKPNSKEAAIVMICDTAEAISRLGNKSNEQLVEMVNTIIRDKFNEGQFDECDITTNELKIVAETLSKTLNGIHHQRTEYKTIVKN
ncbi:MAG: HDIG domain-containing protein [Candidatus Kapabacteria bacterium]|nr:HDIG domain-containing protein [Candidatus Kapabacteria bacterium]